MLKLKPKLDTQPASSTIAKSPLDKVSGPPKAKIALRSPDVKVNIPTKKQKKVLATLTLPISDIPKPEIKVSPNSNPGYLEGLVDGESRPIQLDTDQLKALRETLSQPVISIIGKAGTGKTTTVQAVCLAILATQEWHSVSYREQGSGTRFHAPSIAIVAATNKAANNMAARLVVHEKLGAAGYGFGPNITTCHNLLEYTVDWIIDEDTGNKKPRYYPTRDVLNKLEITHLILEEATLVGASGEIDFFNWEMIRQALPKGCKIIFLGDLNQLPPVIGKSILNYAVQQYPIVELNKVHRQALDNPIIRQALNCIEGKSIVEDYNANSGQGVRVFNGKAAFKYSHHQFELAFRGLMTKMIECGDYDPYTDMTLSPFFKANDKAVSSYNLAAVIASIMAERDERYVYEIRAGFALIYLSVGDRVFHNKQEGIVTKIEANSSYYGRMTRSESKTMDYFGKHTRTLKSGNVSQAATDDDEWADDFEHLSLDEMLEEEAVDEEERKRAASHQVTIEFTRINGEKYDIPFNAVGDVADISLGYALSVHKSQGSEWPRVVLALHDTNTVNLFRELVYTGMTRPKIRLDILAQRHVLDRAIERQRIKGHTLAAKIEFFNSGYLDQEIKIEA